MKNKLLLSTLSVVILTSLSSQTFAIDNYKDEINAPYDYPEHRHEDNRSTIDIANEAKAEKYINIVNEMMPALDIYSTAIETLSPLTNISTAESSNPSSNDPLFRPNYNPPTPVIGTSLSSPTPSALHLQNTLDNLDDKIKDNSLSINVLNSSINDLTDKTNDYQEESLKNSNTLSNSLQKMKGSLSNLEKSIIKSATKNKKHIDDEVFRSEAITTLLINDTNKKHEKDTLVLNTAIEELKISVKDSDAVTSLLIEEAEQKSKEYADVIMRNQQTLNTERFNKLDQQNTLDKRQFKQFNSRLDQMESKINQTARDANAGIASVAAMSNIPYVTGNRFSMGLGAGNFKNGKAVAAGAQYQIKQNLNVRSSISWNNSDSAVIGAGIAYGW